MRIKLCGVSKEFISLRGRVSALKGIDIEIDDGEFFVLLGPSGCGKSTLLNVVAGLEKPGSGQVWFDDKVVADHRKKIFLAPKERNVAFVFQSYALYPHLNTFENIAFPLRIARMKDSVIKEAADWAAATLDISDLLFAKPGELSGGQRQRVAIARAIVRRPNVLLLDEPLSNLDARLRCAMRTELKTLQQRLHVTTVYVTHDQTEAMALGDRIAVLRAGGIEQIGTPRGLYEKPRTTFVAGFIGSPPMNLIESCFVETQGKFHIVWGDRKLEVPAEKIQDLRKLKAKSFILGIRPEHIRINPLGPRQTLKAKIESLEPLGREMLVHICIEGRNLTVLCDNKTIKTGQEVDVELNLNQAHIFDSFS